MPPRPMSACVESQAGAGEVVVRDGADAQAAAPISKRQKKARMCGKVLRRRATGRNKLAQLQAPCCELGDAIRANAVHADLVQCFPLVRIVGGPDDYSRIG